jgi:hypothetical protein
MEYIKIANPKVEGDYLLIAKRDFDPDVHVLFDDVPAPSVVEMPIPQRGNNIAPYDQPIRRRR